MRVEYGFLAERASKIPGNRTVAFGILGRFVHVAESQLGHVMPLAAVVELSFKSPGRKSLDTRVLLPDGTSQPLGTTVADVPGAGSAVSALLEGLLVPLARAGKVSVEMRENGGVWHEVCGMVVVHLAPALPVPAPTSLAPETLATAPASRH